MPPPEMDDELRDAAHEQQADALATERGGLGHNGGPPLDDPSAPPLLHRIPRHGEKLAGFLSRNVVYGLLAEGRLEAVRFGGRQFITNPSLRRLIASLPRAEPLNRHPGDARLPTPCVSPPARPAPASRSHDRSRSRSRT